jgi:hypothetical protein
MSMKTGSVFDLTPWRKGLENNSTRTTAFAITDLDPTTTKPVTVDSSTATGNLLVVPCGLSETQFIFFGTNAANETANIRILLWRGTVSAPGHTAADKLWVPLLVADYAITFGTRKGVAGSDVDADQFFADLNTPSNNYAEIELAEETIANGYAFVRVRTIGFELIEVLPDIDAAASVNCLYAHSTTVGDAL